MGDMRFKNQNDLKAVQCIIDEAELALKDKSRTMSDSQIGDVVGAALICRPWSSFDWLDRMLNPLTWIVLTTLLEKQRLREAKLLIYKDAIKKQNAIIKALLEEKNADKERIDLLTGLNNLLESVIRDLEHDLNGVI